MEKPQNGKGHVPVRKQIDDRGAERRGARGRPLAAHLLRPGRVGRDADHHLGGKGTLRGRDERLSGAHRLPLTHLR